MKKNIPMISSRNIIFIFFLLIFIDNMIPVYGISKCERNILTDFEYKEPFPYDLRLDVPRKAFLLKTINDLTNDYAKNYFKYLHNSVNHKESMLLPSEFCDVRTKYFQLHANESSESEFLKCVDLLHSTFKDSKDKRDIIKSAFWNFTENIISNFDTKDYRYRYFYYLSGKFIYDKTAKQMFPMTVKEFCATFHPDKDIDLMASDVSELTRDQAINYCTTNIFNDFEITSLRKKHKSRIYMPKTAFLSYVEDDLESSDAKDYFFHIYGVIKAKDGTKNPRQYCNTITKEIEEDKKCVGYLLSMYMDSDATTVLKDAFQNFKESHFAKVNKLDYRHRYFYYLSGSYEFYKSAKIFKNVPLTPMEFCQRNRNITLNPRILMESGSISGEGI